MIKEERKRERKRKRRWKAFWITLLTLLVIAGIAFLTAWYFFRVKKVVVEGNELYEDSVIEETILNDEFSWNTLYVYFKYKFTTPETIPFIDTVEVSLDNPSTLHIKVYEKGVMGYFYDENEEQNVYFDKDGFVAEISQRVVEGVPLIKGLEYEEINLYEKLDINQSVLSDLLTLTQTLKRNELVPDSIIYGKENSPILVYKNVWVQLGSIDLISLKLEHLAQILPTLSEESGVLHMENWTEDASNIVFDRDE